MLREKYIIILLNSCALGNNIAIPWVHLASWDDEQCNHKHINASKKYDLKVFKEERIINDSKSFKHTFNES